MITFVREDPDGSLWKVEIDRPEAIQHMADYFQRKFNGVYRIAYGVMGEGDDEVSALMAATIKRLDGEIDVIAEEVAPNEPMKIQAAVDSIVRQSFLYRGQ